jgi:hypothetical protein
LWPFLIDLVDKASRGGYQLSPLCEWETLESVAQLIQGAREREGMPRMRAMFITWLTLIAAGLVLYTVIGLSHN